MNTTANSETTLREQTRAQIEKTRASNPAFMAQAEALIEEARSQGDGAQALEVGETAPDWTLPNANGTPFSLAEALKAGPVVLTFYRGGWCPYCNLQLRALSAAVPQMRALGAQLVAVSPQTPDASISQLEKEALDFAVLSDDGARVAQQYGVAWHLPEDYAEHLKERGLDLETINAGNTRILPIPATFVLESSGRIAWRFVDVDFRQRAEPADILDALRNLAR